MHTGRGSEEERRDRLRTEGQLPWENAPQRELLRLAWPIVVTTVSFSLMTLTDTAFVGRLGTAELAGVGLGGVAAFALLCFALGLLRAVKVLTAQAVGAGRTTDAGPVLGAAFTYVLGLGMVAVLLGQLVAEVLPTFAATPEAGMHARDYVRVRILGAPLVLATAALRELRYGLGDSRSPMWAVISANLVNAGLDAVFIFGLGLGVQGAALASVLAQAIAVGVLVHVQPLRGLRVVPSHVRALWRLGLPMGVQFLLEVGSFALMSTLVASFGERDMAAHQVALSVVHLTFLPTLAVGEAGSILVGRAVGAGRDGLVRRVARGAAAVAGIYAALCTVALAGFGELIARGFSEDAALVGLAARLLAVAAVFQLTDAANVVARSALQGTGDVRWAAIIGIGCAWLLLPTLTWLLGHGAGLGVVGAWIAISAEVTLAGLLYWWRLERGGWHGAANRSRDRLEQTEGRPSVVPA